MSTAAIASIAVGGVAGVIFLLGIAFFTRGRWWPKTHKVSDEHDRPGTEKAELDSTALDVAKKNFDPTAHSDGNFYGGNINRNSAHDKGSVEADCNGILIPELHTTDKTQHKVMGNIRPAVELSGPTAAAELPNGLAGPRVFRTLDGWYELP